MRRDPEELDGFLDFLAGEISHDGLATVVARILGDNVVRSAFPSLPAAGADGTTRYAGGLLEHTVGVATLCRETAQLHPRLRGDLLARRRAPARRRAHARARARAGVSRRPRRGACSVTSISACG